MGINNKNRIKNKVIGKYIYIYIKIENLTNMRSSFLNFSF